MERIFILDNLWGVSLSTYKERERERKEIKEKREYLFAMLLPFTDNHHPHLNCIFSHYIHSYLYKKQDNISMQF